MILVGKKDLQESSAKNGNGSYLSFLFAILTKDPMSLAFKDTWILFRAKSGMS